MIDREAFAVAPWTVSEPTLRRDLLAQTETIFALSNGHIGLRGNLDEGEPHATPGTYLAAFFETEPMPHPEAGYGYPEERQTLINVTDGKLIRLLVDDEPFDVRYGTLTRHERVLNLRDGVLHRDVEWTSPADQAVRVRSTRLVLFVQRAVAAVRYEVEPIGVPARVVVNRRSWPTSRCRKDPRIRALHRPTLTTRWRVSQSRRSRRCVGHRTRRSGLRIAAGIDHVVDGPMGLDTASESEADLAQVTIAQNSCPASRSSL